MKIIFLTGLFLYVVVFGVRSSFATEGCLPDTKGSGICKVAVMAANTTKKETKHDEHGHDHEHDEKPKETTKSTEAKKDEHDHDHEEGETAQKDEHKHEEKNSHSDHGKDEHAHGGEEHGEDEHASSSSVGPDKGVVEASPEKGFKLSAEAMKQFDLKYISVGSNRSAQIPNGAVVHTGEEKNLYRMRNDFIKRIDFQVVSKGDKSVTVQSKELAPGDQIVVQGLGFLRIAEITTFDGAPQGHAH